MKRAKQGQVIQASLAGGLPAGDVMGLQAVVVGTTRYHAGAVAGPQGSPLGRGRGAAEVDDRADVDAALDDGSQEGVVHQISDGGDRNWSQSLDDAAFIAHT